MEVKTGNLLEHPQNRDYFDDIKQTDPSFWEEFKDSIKQFGIIEPLIVNADTMQVQSGNQRLKAAIELELDRVPAIFRESSDSDDEIKRMIASNVYRRQISPFAMFKYIGMLRRGSSSKGVPNAPTSGNANEKDVRKKVGKKSEFVSAADIFNSLDEDAQGQLRQWFENESNQKEGELVAQLRQLQQEKLESDQKYQELMDEKQSEEDRAEKLEQMLTERDDQIEELESQRSEEGEENLEKLDAMIRTLEKEKQTLRRKVKELQEVPDVAVLLRQAIKDATDLNSVLKEVIDNRESLNGEQFNKLMGLLERTYQIVGERAKGAAKTNLIEGAE